MPARRRTTSSRRTSSSRVIHETEEAPGNRRLFRCEHRRSDGDDYLRAGVMALQILDRRGGLAQRVRSIYDRRDLPGFDKLDHGDEAVFAALRHEWHQLL